VPNVRPLPPALGWRPPSTASITVAHGETSAAVSPLADGDPRVGDAQRLTGALVLAGTTALMIGGALALAQRAAWLLLISEIVTGALVGVSLVPLRRHVDVSARFERVATGFFVCATYGIYLAASCVALDATPATLLAGAAHDATRTAMAAAGFTAKLGAALFVFKLGVSWVVARAVLRLSGDVSAHEHAAAAAEGRWQ
jgi:hypothetical protein